MKINKNIRKITAWLLFINLQLFAQSGDKSQSIELPDFVITGIQSVTLPTINKKKSDFVPVIGKSFLTPKFDNEEFALIDHSAPIKKQMDLYSSVEHYNGLLKIGAGTQTLPIGSFEFGFDKNNFLLFTKIMGSNIRDYLPYSSYNSSGGEIDLSYFVSHKSRSFPGLKISAKGSFFRDLYNFYGSTNKSRARENHIYKGDLSFLNLLSKKFRYGIEVSGNSLDMKEDGVKETVSQLKGFAEIKVASFLLGGAGFYQVGQHNGTTFYNRFDYFGGDIYLDFNSSSFMELKLGANYTQIDDDQIVSPKASLSIFVEKGTALFFAFEGGSKLFTYKDFLVQNKYFELDKDYILQKCNYKMTVAIKYDFETLFDLNAGFYSGMYDNYHYFEDDKKDNKFNIFTQNNVNEIGAFLNLSVNTEKYGSLYANFEFKNVKDSAGVNYLPYIPTLVSNVSYGYQFGFGLFTKATFNYSGLTYQDLANQERLDNYMNLALLLKYKLFRSLSLSLELQNIMDKENFLLKGYQEKPRDVIIGVEYSW